MNMPPRHDEPDLPTDEWDAQERALRAERLNLPENDQDARSRAYRRIARTLRQPLPDALPADFATRVARKARNTRARAREGSEHLIGAVLLLALTVAGIGYGTASAGAWWQAAVDGLPLRTLTSPWLLALGACAGLTALLQIRPVTRLHGGNRPAP
jgi:hypothetical protein